MGVDRGAVPANAGACAANNRAMQSELERDDQVVARVVAWHNRHPLATRISADQVHSVGVVSLPFAVHGAVVLAPPGPAVAGLPLPANPAPEAAVELAIEAPETETATPPAPGAGGAEPSPAALEGAVDPSPPPALPAADAPAAPAGAMPAAAPLLSTLPPRPRSWHPLTWWRRLRGHDPFRALFSEDFIEPLRPRRVARWAAAHGVGHLPLAADAPHRRVALDPQRRRSDDGAPETELHLITAAIGVGDERRRLLLAPGARGAILGPRHWSRPRLAGAGALAMVLLTAVLLPLAARPALRGGAGATALAAVPAASSPAAAAPGSAPAVDEPPEGAMTTAASTGPAGARMPTRLAVAPPPDAAPLRGRIALEPLVPRLADAERQELRRSGRDLRRQSSARGEARAWALVTAPLDQRRADRATAQLRAVALFQALPMRVEQLPAGRQWRAVFWPFTSAQDAEKVRLALADKGLQTEVLEF